MTITMSMRLLIDLNITLSVAAAEVAVVVLVAVAVPICIRFGFGFASRVFWHELKKPRSVTTFCGLGCGWQWMVAASGPNGSLAATVEAPALWFPPCSTSAAGAAQGRNILGENDIKLITVRYYALLYPSMLWSYV